MTMMMMVESDSSIGRERAQRGVAAGNDSGSGSGNGGEHTQYRAFLGVGGWGGVVTLDCIYLCLERQNGTKGTFLVLWLQWAGRRAQRKYSTQRSTQRSIQCSAQSSMEQHRRGAARGRRRLRRVGGRRAARYSSTVSTESTVLRHEQSPVLNSTKRQVCPVLNCTELCCTGWHYHHSTRVHLGHTVHALLGYPERSPVTSESSSRSSHVARESRHQSAGWAARQLGFLLSCTVLYCAAVCWIVRGALGDRIRYRAVIIVQSSGPPLVLVLLLCCCICRPQPWCIQYSKQDGAVYCKTAAPLHRCHCCRPRRALRSAVGPWCLAVGMGLESRHNRSSAVHCACATSTESLPTLHPA